MSQARVTNTPLEVLVQANSRARISRLMLEVVHNVQERAPPPPPSGRRRAVVIMMG